MGRGGRSQFVFSWRQLTLLRLTSNAVRRNIAGSIIEIVKGKA